ncbi:NAD(P)H-dependent FMN reductase [Methylohalomonas lacus]|uniref:NAD(P)H-dependent FMN reductase n=1 Tax=Methylohalomonas lacus TaxID=398773 RepID=A0AAE3L1L8_9GAMM|nr:NAD(P)H-dependent oxidoreductase [Methylohalomonas lacus]MCS3904254.1 NAD(P)H-dependent FMN reductase [Methylohalomonas lacus]
MAEHPKLLFLAGSARQGSFNRKLAKLAAGLAEGEGANVTLLELADYPLPIYNGDLEEEQGIPKPARELKKKFIDCDGFFIASPEYNSSIPPLLKNTLDWLSRKESADEPPLAAYKGKVAALSAASPGGNGGLRGLVPLRMMLGNIGVHLIPQQLAVAGAGDAFDDDGRLKSDQQLQTLTGIMRELVRVSRQLRD